MIGCVFSLSACSLGYWSPRFWIPSEARSQVEQAAYRYNNALRFGNLEMAIKSVEPDRREEFLRTFDASAPRAIRFTEMDIQSVSLGPERAEARVLLLIRFYRLPSIREFAVTHEQRWRYDPSDSLWYVSPDAELFASRDREPLPSVTR